MNLNNENNTETISISKYEYDNLKIYEKEVLDFEFSDFVLKLKKGKVLPPKHPNYNHDRVNIEIFNKDEHSILINGKNYSINSQNLFNKIEKIVSNNLKTLINWSVKQNKINLDNNAYEGGISRSIKIKYGNLIININGQVSDIGKLCDEFIEKIKVLIINEGDIIQG